MWMVAIIKYQREYYYLEYIPNGLGHYNGNFVLNQHDKSSRGKQCELFQNIYI